MVPLKDYIRKCESKRDMYCWWTQIMDFFSESTMQFIDSLDKYPFGKGYSCSMNSLFQILFLYIIN